METSDGVWEYTDQQEWLGRVAKRNLPPLIITVAPTGGVQGKEINPNHPILGAMQSRYESNKEDPLLVDYADLLFGQALLSEGEKIPDPVSFSRKVAELMVGRIKGDPQDEKSLS